MARRALEGRCILVVEDDYMIAMDLADTLVSAGAMLLGPASHVSEALTLIEGASGLDFAVLDLDLHGSPSYPIADVLIERNIPFLFATGFERDGIAPRYRSYLRLEKPLRPQALVATLAAARPVRP